MTMMKMTGTKLDDLPPKPVSVKSGRFRRSFCKPRWLIRLR